MPGLDAVHLGNLIFSARNRNDLTQKELAQQTGLSIKTIHDVEKGRKYPSYETLARLIARLEIPPDAIFPRKDSITTIETQQLLELFGSNDVRIQEIMHKTICFLAEQLCALQHESDQ